MNSLSILLFEKRRGEEREEKIQLSLQTIDQSIFKVFLSFFNWLELSRVLIESQDAF